MTTEVKVTVPESADYKVWVFLDHGKNEYGNQRVSCVQVFPGQSYTSHIHNGLRVLGIEEVPIRTVMVLDPSIVYRNSFTLD